MCGVNNNMIKRFFRDDILVHVMQRLMVCWDLELVVESVEGGAITRLRLAQFPSQIEALVPQTLQTAETHLLLALLRLNPNPRPGSPIGMADVVRHGGVLVAILGQHGAVSLRQELQGIYRLPDYVAVQVHAQFSLPVAVITIVVVVFVLPGAVGGVTVHLRLGHGLVGCVLCDLAQVEQRLGDQLVVVLVILSGAVTGADGAAIIVVVVLLNWNELRLSTGFVVIFYCQKRREKKNLSGFTSKQKTHLTSPVFSRVSLSILHHKHHKQWVIGHK